MKVLDEETVARCDGQEGRPSHVVVDGRVYDVTQSPRWPGGVHMRRHRAGADLTADLAAAPHGVEKLESFPLVGVLAPKSAPAAPDTGVPESVARLLERFPSLRRHPHPMTVHFPIACAFAVLFFALLRALTGVESFGTTTAHCLGAGVLVTPAAMATGWLTWRVNYLGSSMTRILWKIPLSFLLWALFVFGAGASLGAPPAPAFHLVLGAAVTVVASVLGRIGASLTFPSARR